MSELATSSDIVNVTEANFQEAVVEASRSRPVVVDFWAPWCEPCRLMTPLLEKLVTEKKGRILFAKVNVDDAKTLAQEFGIEGIPAIRVIHQGKLLGGFDGVKTEAQLRELFDHLAPLEQVDKDLAQAVKLEAKLPEQAETLYRAVLEKYPERTEAHLGVARTMMSRNLTDEAVAYLDEQTLEGDHAAEAEKIKSGIFFRKLTTSTEDEATLREKIASDPKAAQACYDLGCLLAARGDHEQALALLLQAGERDYNLANTKVREVMVKIFYAMGANHPVANDYRARLATLLY